MGGVVEQWYGVVWALCDYKKPKDGGVCIVLKFGVLVYVKRVCFVSGLGNTKRGRSIT